MASSVEVGSRSHSPKSRWDKAAAIAVTLTCVVLLTDWVYQKFSARPLTASLTSTAARKQAATPQSRGEVIPKDPVSLEGAATKGAPTAKVALIEFADYECGYCRRFDQEILPAIEKRYVAPGKVLYAFKQFPLAIHRLASAAGTAALCAGEQGKFWEMHDWLFRQQQLDEETIQQQAQSLRLEASKFEICRMADATARLSDDEEQAKTLGITGTPSFLVGTVDASGRVKVTERFKGLSTVAEVGAMLDRALGLK